MTAQEQWRRFVQGGDVQVEELPWGPHDWLCRPGLTDAKKLLVVRVHMPAGKAHQFHRHPEMEEVLYVLEGRVEQWVGQEKKVLGPGELAHIPLNEVHGSYNVFEEPVKFLAILSPATCDGPMLIDCCTQEPWCTLKTPVEY
ncbi:MAG: cupin domain-containing protein [Planctomycetota bacterium]